VHTVKMDSILAEYTEGRAHYDALKDTVEKTIEGRCCHHHVVILNILVKLYAIEIYLEIGVHNGTSMSYVVNQTVKPVQCIGIDLFSSTERYARDHITIARSEQNITRLNTSHSTIHLLKGDSQSESMVKRVQNALLYKPVDLLFIDGDHEFAGVERDFLLYSPFVRSGGLIVFDDANATYPGILKCIEKHVKQSNSFRIIGLFENTDLIVQKL